MESTNLKIPSRTADQLRSLAAIEGTSISALAADLLDRALMERAAREYNALWRTRDGHAAAARQRRHRAETRSLAQ